MDAAGPVRTDRPVVSAASSRRAGTSVRNAFPNGGCRPRPPLLSKYRPRVRQFCSETGGVFAGSSGYVPRSPCRHDGATMGLLPTMPDSRVVRVGGRPGIAFTADPFSPRSRECGAGGILDFVVKKCLSKYLAGFVIRPTAPIRTTSRVLLRVPSFASSRLGVQSPSPKNDRSPGRRGRRGWIGGERGRETLSSE